MKSCLRRDDINNFTVTKQIFEELELVTHSEQDYRLVRHVCSLVSKRAAYLASAGSVRMLDNITVISVLVHVLSPRSCRQCSQGFKTRASCWIVSG